MMQTWNLYLPVILTLIRTPDLTSNPNARLITEAYLVPSPDKQTGTWSIPVI